MPAVGRMIAARSNSWASAFRHRALPWTRTVRRSTVRCAALTTSVYLPRRGVTPLRHRRRLPLDSAARPRDIPRVVGLVREAGSRASDAEMGARGRLLAPLLNGVEVLAERGVAALRRVRAGFEAKDHLSGYRIGHEATAERIEELTGLNPRVLSDLLTLLVAISLCDTQPATART